MINIYKRDYIFFKNFKKIKKVKQGISIIYKR